MTKKIKRIEILDEKEFNKLIEKYDFDKFSCSAESLDETNVIMRIAIFSNKELFEDCADLLSCSDFDFSLFSGRRKLGRYYVAMEIYK